MSVTQRANGETVIVGLVKDQPALYGLLNWTGDLGIILLSDRRVDKEESTFGQVNLEVRINSETPNDTKSGYPLLITLLCKMSKQQIC